MEKPAFITKNMTINLKDLLSKNVEGFNVDMYNREKQRIKNTMTKDVGELMYSLS